MSLARTGSDLSPAATRLLRTRRSRRRTASHHQPAPRVCLIRVRRASSRATRWRRRGHGANILELEAECIGRVEPGIPVAMALPDCTRLGARGTTTTSSGKINNDTNRRAVGRLQAVALGPSEAVALTQRSSADLTEIQSSGLP